MLDTEYTGAIQIEYRQGSQSHFDIGSSNLCHAAAPHENSEEFSRDDMTTSAAQLFLLSDHIKLSLLERRRASSLDLDPGTHNAEISRSLDSFKSGLDALKSQQEIG